MIEIFLLFTTFLFFFFSAHLWQENQELKRNLSKDENKVSKSLNEEKNRYCMKKISNQDISPESKESLKKEFQNIQRVIEKSNISENNPSEIQKIENQNSKISTIPQKELFSQQDSIQNQSHSNFSSEQLNFSDFIQQNKNIEKQKNTQSNINTKMDYMKNLSQQLEQEIKPQTIELTDYEKKQEETAIISYKELLSSSKNQQEKEEYNEKELLEELKKFRNYLN